MKTFATRVFETAAGTVAAALIVAATFTPAYAQAPRVKGNIPFNFAANRQALTAGNYQISPVTQVSSPAAVVLYNKDQHKSTMIAVIDRITYPKDPTARVEFSCSNEACQLVRIYDGVNGWDVAAPKTHSAEKERLLAVKLAVAGK